MSWWDTGESDDLIGDQPADAVRHSLQRIAATRKPTLEELLQAVATVASVAGKKLLDNVPAGKPTISVKLKSGETLSVSASGDKTDHELETVLRENLVEVQKLYQEQVERNPRLTEWLSVFAFVMRYKPKEFVSDGAARSPADITLQL